ncbi:MAG: peptidoglycan-binding protein [Alphaproteobacteria bacterium]|nr:peptidoglycan-binding protein [Alphaproteobacteria bacterium]
MTRSNLSLARIPLAVALMLGSATPLLADDLGGKISGAFTSAYKGLKEGVLDAYEGGTEGAKDTWHKTKAEANKALGNNTASAPSTGSPYPPIRDDLTLNVQTELNAAGYTSGPADGIYGPRTAEAIRAYQGNNALPQDGQVSIALLDHLRSKRSGVAPTAAYTPPAPTSTAPALQPAPVTPPAPAVGSTAATAPSPTAAPAVPALPPAPGQAAGNAAGQQAAGTPQCKPYETRLMVDGKEQVRQGTACLQPDGTWKPTN